MGYFFFTVFIAFHLGLSCFGYELPLYTSIRNEDDIHQFIEDSIVTEEIGKILLELYENPVDLNRANKDELMLLPYISEQEASSIIEQRSKLGGFKKWIDLAMIEGISPIELKQIQYFAYIIPDKKFANGWLRLNFSEVENDGKPGYSRLYAQTHTDNLTFGIAAKHEDDKQYKWENGIQSVSPWNIDKLFIEWRRKGVFKQIVLGNFSAGFGSGLVFNDAHRRNLSGRIYPDYSLSTYRQKGLAIDLGWRQISSTMFFSSSQYPVTLPTEMTQLQRKLKIQNVYYERLFGGDLTLKLNSNSTAGVTFYQSWNKKNLDFSFEDFPNRKKLGSLGVHFNTEIKNIALSGELAHNINGANAIYLGISSITKKIYWSWGYRNYETDFENPHSYGYSDPGQELNEPYGDIDEVGSYLFLRYSPNTKFTMKISYDGYKHPSSNIANNKICSLLDFNLTNWCKMGSSMKFYNIDLIDYDESRKANVIWIKLLPINNFRLITVYRLASKKEDKIKYDDYIYLKVEWQTRKDLEFEGRWKIYDTKLIDGDTYPKQLYIQMQFQIYNFSARIKFTHTRYGNSRQAYVNPRKQIFLAAKLDW